MHYNVNECENESSFCSTLYQCIFKEKKLDLILLLKILNWISQKFLTMPKTINTKSLTEAWEEEKCLLDVSSVIYKNCYKKVKSTKKLAEPYCQKPYCCS